MNLLLLALILTLLDCSSITNYQKVKLFRSQTDEGYYLEMFLGNPPQKQLMFIDTGSDLMNIKCAECTNCEGTTYKNYQSKKSSTASSVLCNSSQYQCTNKCKSTSTYEECELIYKYISTESMGVIRKDQVDLSPNPSKDNQFQVQFLCSTSVKESLETQTKYNGIFGMCPSSPDNKISNWFTRKGQDIPKTIGLCMSSDYGYLQLGSNTEGFDSKNQNVIISQFVPLVRALITTQITELKIGQLDLHGSVEVKYGIPLDSGSTLSYIPLQKYNQLLEMTDKICNENLVNCKKQKEDNPVRCYILTNPSLISTPFAYLNKIFPTFQVTINSSKISTKPSDYFIYHPMNGGKSGFCLGFKDSTQNHKQFPIILGLQWLFNKKLTFNLDGGYMQIRPDSDCSYDQTAASNESNATLQAILSYFTLLLVFVLIVFIPKLIHKCSNLKAKILIKRPQLVEQHPHQEVEAQV